MTDCPLCRPVGEVILWRGKRLRVILANDADYPGFCRVVWNDHVREMTDLDGADASHFMKVVLATESALREVARPHKINLASLGNQVPHLHWHVIPRFEDDAHFPDPVWATRKRSGRTHALDAERMRDALAQHLGAPGE